VEFCAGKLEPGEAPASAAGRELIEETGYRAGSIRALGTFLTSPGFADEWMHVFEARNLVPVPRDLQPGERIEVLLETPDTVAAWIRDGRIQDGKTIASFHLWQGTQA
jgi:ADP-ribose pyrophosphatase